MKKKSLIYVAFIGLLSLIACSGEKTYNYDNYKRLLAKKEFAPQETKVHIDIEEDGVKTTSDLTYDSDSGRWIGTVIEDFEETKVHIDIEEDGVKTTSDLTYDSDSGRWIGTVIEDFDGEEIEMTTYEALNIVPFVSTLSKTAEYLNMDVNKAYKFYVSKDEYRIVIKASSGKGTN